eukprot:5975401-Pyramimonas_sp.AAC.1
MCNHPTQSWAGQAIFAALTYFAPDGPSYPTCSAVSHTSPFLSHETPASWSSNGRGAGCADTLAT